MEKHRFLDGTMRNGNELRGRFLLFGGMDEIESRVARSVEKRGEKGGISTVFDGTRVELLELSGSVVELAGNQEGGWMRRAVELSGRGPRTH